MRGGIAQGVQGLHASFESSTWVVERGPLLAYGVVAPFVGKAGDLFGHHQLFIADHGRDDDGFPRTHTNISMLIAAPILGSLVGASIGAT